MSTMVKLSSLASVGRAARGPHCDGAGAPPQQSRRYAMLDVCDWARNMQRGYDAPGAGRRRAEGVTYLLVYLPLIQVNKCLNKLVYKWVRRTGYASNLSTMPSLDARSCAMVRGIWSMSYGVIW